jgi:hypothetical protein
LTVPRIVGVQEKRLARPIDRRSGGPCLHRISERGRRAEHDGEGSGALKIRRRGKSMVAWERIRRARPWPVGEVGWERFEAWEKKGERKMSEGNKASQHMSPYLFATPTYGIHLLDQPYGITWAEAGCSRSENHGTRFVLDHFSVSTQPVALSRKKTPRKSSIIALPMPFFCFLS